ncbi:nicotinic acetylcholine receptor subunit alpha 5 isoform A precursor, partial [Danaus plexippus plexippus]
MEYKKEVRTCDEEYQLIRHLMGKYDASVRPVENSSHPLLVTFGVSLHHIIDVEEKDQLLTTNCWITQIWTDHHLRWNVSDFDGINVIRIPYERVWKPDIILYNNADPNYRSAVINTNVIVKNTGEVTWLSHGIYVSVCDINVEQFPFDIQLCTMKWASWTYDGFQILHAIRNDSYHVRITLLVFYVPSESGEKVTLGISALLSMTVFLMTIRDTLPPTEKTPLISLYYGVSTCLVTFSASLSVFTLNISYRQTSDVVRRGVRGQPVPAIVRELVLQRLARLLCINFDTDVKNDSTVTTGVQVNPRTGSRLKAEILDGPAPASPRFTRNHNHL